ncbi:hypothetical protein FSP39_012476 [Pinctada imbricata]|uniref:Uncharacterized protein n=1 Tax=Pinctada imbricata TaxID=66713 RepID=A0AA88YCQ3_PINIB|nr:hypothetical protein FSP39_012476 [Pinctada imbricata]
MAAMAKNRIQAEVQHIGNTEVHGAPDLVYYTRRCVKQEQVVAVVEVKRERGIMKEFSVSPPSSKTRNKLKEKEMEFAVSSSSNTEKLRPHISKIMGHLDDNLIGQHGGELLFLSQNSFRENKVFGIIVQETMVTFTALNIGKKQFENIVSGELFHKKDQEASLVISKPYDYLKESDREIVSEVLITLGMYQRKM